MSSQGPEDPRSATGSEFTPLVGVESSLRPIVPSDYEHLYRLELGAEWGRRWRLKGATPSFERWREGLWQGVLAQFLVVDRTLDAPSGLVTAYNANLRDQWCYLALIKFAADADRERFFQGVAIFLSYLFSTWDFRKIYAEVSGYNLVPFQSAVGSVASEEGVLRSHEFAAGKWWDVHVLAIYRNEWDRWESLLSERIFTGRKYRQEGDSIKPTREWTEDVPGT